MPIWLSLFASAIVLSEIMRKVHFFISVPKRWENLMPFTVIYIHLDNSFTACK